MGVATCIGLSDLSLAHENAARLGDLFSELLVERGTTDENGSYPQEEMEQLRRVGLLLAPMSRELGGIGLGSESGTYQTLLNILASIGGGNLSVARLYEGHVNALLLIQLYGTELQRKRAAGDARRGAVFGVWNTGWEPLMQFVPLDNNCYRIEGGKAFASGAGSIQSVVLTGALPDASWQMCIVPLDEVPLKVDRSSWNPIGMQASSSFNINLTGTVVQAEWLLGEPGAYYLQPMFGGGSIRFAAAHLGAAERLLQSFHRWLRDSNRASDPYQISRFAQLAISLEQGRLWLRRAAQFADKCFFSGDPHDAGIMVGYSNMVRTAIAQICSETMNGVMSGVGARGLLRPNIFEAVIRDLTMYIRQPAPDQILAAVGKSILASGQNPNHAWRLRDLD